MARNQEHQHLQVRDHLLAAARQAQAHREQYQRTGVMVELDEAVARWEKLLAHPDLVAAPIDFRASVLNEAGMAMDLRFQASGCEGDLNRALDLWQKAIAATPPDSPNLYRRVNNLGSGFARRFRYSHQIRDLEEAEACFRSVLAIAPAGSSARQMGLHNLASSLVNLCEARGKFDLLDKAVAHFREALFLSLEGSPERLAILDALTEALRRSYSQTHGMQDMEDLLTSEREALIMTPAGHPERKARLAGLVIDLHTAYQHKGRLEDLDEALAYQREVLILTAAGDPSYPALTGLLGLLLEERHKHAGRLEDLDEAIRLLQLAVDSEGADPESQAERISNLASATILRYSRTGRLRDLEKSLNLYRKALTLAPNASNEYGSHLANLAYGLNELYRCNGRAEDLDEAVSLYREALSLFPEGSRARASPLNGFATALKDCYLRTGRIEDLDEAILMWREALPLEPQESEERPTLLSNLGTGLRARYARTLRIENLNEAVELLRQAVILTSTESIERPWRLSNLANALGDRYGRESRIEDLEGSLAAYREAVAGAPQDAPDRPRLLSNMGMGLRDLYRCRGRLEDLNEAIGLFRQSLDSMRRDSLDRPSALLNLGSSLRDRHFRLKDPDDLTGAIAAYEQTILQGADLLPETVIIASRAWSLWALERKSYNEAAKAAAYGLSQMEKLLKVQYLRRHREDWLPAVEGLAATGAYAMAVTGDLERAVETLERGRAHLLSESLERRRRTLDRLVLLGHGELLDEYRQASSEWELLTERLRQLQETFSDRADASAASRKHIDACHVRHEKIIDRMRLIPGYENFMSAPTFSDIQAAAEQVPLVYLTSTSGGGLALIVRGAAERRNEPPVEAVPLPQLTKTALIERLFGTAGAGEIGNYLGAYAHRASNDKAAFAKWLNALDEITHWMWESVMEPVVKALVAPHGQIQAQGERGPIKAVLIPGGLLGLLPLHAAWCSDLSAPSQRHYALDDVEWRYAPNARALSAAYAGLDDLADDYLLLVVDPKPVSGDQLPFARDEAKAIIQHWPEQFRTSRWHSAATHDEVIALLPQCRVLHYAGHAFAGWDKPQEGGLLLAENHVLSVREIQGMDLKMRLAVLSACETGVPGLSIPDEVISLPTALVEAGVLGVVASLWAVPDATTAQIMEQFYSLWRNKEKGMEPSKALISAQRAMRDSGGYDHPYYWAAFTYNGA